MNNNNKKNNHIMEFEELHVGACVMITIRYTVQNTLKIFENFLCFI